VSNPIPESPPTRRRDLTLLCLAGISAALGYTTLGLLAPLVALRFGAGPAAVGALISAGFVLPLLLAVPAGAWADRWGARRAARLGFLAFAASTLPMALAPGWATLIVAYVVASLAHLVYIVGSQALVAELGDAGRAREAAYGWWTTSVAVGQAIGPLAGGVVLDLQGPGAGFGLMTAVMLLAFVLTLPMRATGLAETAPARFEWSTARRLLGDRTVGLAMLTSSAALWAVTVQVTFLPVHLELLAVPAASIGALLSLRALVAVLVRPWMPRLVEALGGRERTMVLTLLSMAAGLAGVAFGGSWWLLALFMVVFGAGFGLSQPVSMVTVADRVAPRERGAALGVRLTGNRLAQLVAPVALVVVAERAGLPAFFVLHGLLVLGAAVLLGAWARRGRGIGAPTGGRSET
jgi:MFS family permease